MSPNDLRQPLHLPPVNWNKILIWSASAMGIVTLFALLSRARTFLILAQILDVTLILGLLAVATYALIRSSQK